MFNSSGISELQPLHELFRMNKEIESNSLQTYNNFIQLQHFYYFLKNISVQWIQNLGRKYPSK